jgi:hypothetical protein
VARLTALEVALGIASGTTVPLVSPSITTPTVTGGTFTAPSISSPVISGAGYIQVAVVDLAGAAWHTGNGTADFLSWAAPADIVIERVVVNTTTKSTGAATVDIGTTATNNHTNGDNLLDALDIGSATTVASNVDPVTAVDTEKSVVALASGKWVTFHALADPTGLVGKAYIYYFTL